jgi:anti-sigma regulatory factor (Ser/Thr protein kinase)
MGERAPHDGSVPIRPEGRPMIVSRVFSSAAASVPAARSWACANLRGRGVTGDLSELVELLVSEVVTNAVRHTGGARFTVRMDVGDWIEVAVKDSDPLQPRTCQPSAWGLNGRGLLLVDALSDAWGTRSARGGKWVWFRILGASK